jgi:diguanylate cyclase (GGDEF)-like protein
MKLNMNFSVCILLIFFAVSGLTSGLYYQALINTKNDYSPIAQFQESAIIGFIEQNLKGTNSHLQKSFSRNNVAARFKAISAFGLIKNGSKYISWGTSDDSHIIFRYTTSIGEDSLRFVIQIAPKLFNEKAPNALIYAAGGIITLILILTAIFSLLRFPLTHLLSITSGLVEKEGRTTFSLNKWFYLGEAIKDLQHLFRMKDIVSSKSKEVTAISKRLKYSSSHDFLTGLPNQNMFKSELNRKVKQEPNQLYGLLHIDLDGFGVINETNGHEFGDGVLKLASRRISNYARNLDGLTGRTQGDTYMLFLPISNESGLKNCGLELLNLMTGEYNIGEDKVSLTAVVGGAHLEAGESANELISKVHTAVFSAKRHGKGCFVEYESGLREAHVRRTEIKQALNRAIENEELEIVFQPIIELESGSIAGVEALCRWFDGNGTVRYHPEEFISVAEESGLIIELDKLALISTCKFIKQLSDKGINLVGSVNFSPANFNNCSASETITRTIQRSGVAPELIEIEITERTLLEHESIKQQFEQISAFGVGISIDDFGVGYSRLASIKDYGQFITKIKLDKAFVDKLKPGNDDVNSKVVNLILKLSDSMEIHTVAEGIETELQNTRLKQMGCLLGQGWLFGKAIKKDALYAQIVDEHDKKSSKNNLIKIVR